MIDVIIPCYNETPNLIKLLGQLSDKIKEKKINVIIADSPKSIDNCNHLVNRHGAQYIKCKKAGRADQLNEGARAGHSQSLMFLHADVFPPSDFINQIESALNKGNEAGFFSYRFDSRSILLKFNALFTKKDGYFAGGGDQCQFMTRAVFDQMDGYDENWIIMEDFHMIDRIRKAKIPYTLINSDAIVSARKYQNRSYWNVNYINLKTFLKYKFGASPDSLYRYYRSLIRE